MTDFRLQQQLGATHNQDAETASHIRLSEQQVISKFVSERTRAAWPCVQVELEPFVAHVASILDRSLPLDQALAQMSIEDLFLAYACSQQNSGALAAFTREFETELNVVCARFRVGRDDLDDIRQSLWNKLFIPCGESPPVISKYSGQGQLRHWFRTAASSTACCGSSTVSFR